MSRQAGGLHVAAWAKWIIPQCLSGLKPASQDGIVDESALGVASVVPVTLSVQLDVCLWNQIQLQRTHPVSSSLMHPNRLDLTRNENYCFTQTRWQKQRPWRKRACNLMRLKTVCDRCCSHMLGKCWKDKRRLWMFNAFPFSSLWCLITSASGWCF